MRLFSSPKRPKQVWVHAPSIQWQTVSNRGVKLTTPLHPVSKLEIREGVPPPLSRMTSWHVEEKSISLYFLGKHSFKRHFLTSHVAFRIVIRNSCTLFLPGLRFVFAEMLFHDRLTTLSAYLIFWPASETTHHPTPHPNPSSFRFPE